MRVYENYCVDCPDEMGCLGRSCPYVDVPVDYCDFCGRDNALYKVDGYDYCEECLKDYLQDIFDDLSLSDRAKVLGVYISKIFD